MALHSSRPEPVFEKQNYFTWFWVAHVMQMPNPFFTLGGFHGGVYQTTKNTISLCEQWAIYVVCNNKQSLQSCALLIISSQQIDMPASLTKIWHEKLS